MASIFGSCKVNSETIIVQQPVVDPIINDPGDEEEFDVSFINEIYSTHCYNNVTLYWKKSDNTDINRYVVKYCNRIRDVDINNENEIISVVIDDIPVGQLIDFRVEALDAKGNIVDYEQLVNFAGHALVEQNYDYDFTDNVGKFEIEYVTYAGPSGVTKSSVILGEKVVIPPESVITVEMDDYCSYRNYCENPKEIEKIDFLKGSFTSKNSVTLNPFALTTTEIYSRFVNILRSGVSDTSPSNDSAYTGVSFLRVIKFCNELTKRLMSEKDCVYYSDPECTKIYKDDSSPVFYVNEYCKGFRLPTKAEWEFAARGGNPNSKKWGYAYSGINCDSERLLKGDNSSDDLLMDDNLLRNAKTGNKTSFTSNNNVNSLGLLDMTGNAWEYTLDYHFAKPGSSDENERKNYYSVCAVGGASDASLSRYCFLNSFSKEITGNVYFEDEDFDKKTVTEIKPISMQGFRLARSL